MRTALKVFGVAMLTLLIIWFLLHSPPPGEEGCRIDDSCELSDH